MNESVLGALLREGPLHIDGMTFYLQNGQIRSRPSTNALPTDEKEREKKKGKKRSPKQAESSVRFTGVRSMTRLYPALSADVRAYEIISKRLKVTGENAYHVMNNKAFDTEANSIDPTEYLFSAGGMSNLRALEIEREYWQITLRWNDPREQSIASPTDRVRVGYFYNSEPDFPILVTEPLATRTDSTCTLTIPASVDSHLHLHVFMEKANKSAYSTDRYFRLREERMRIDG